jgi:MoxR-like ATPase
MLGSFHEKKELSMTLESYRGTESYIASDELCQIVNVAISLKRPLLVRGEPGTGKTLLSHSISEALSLPMFTWHVKSTTKARDGLYVYDTVQRLNDSRFDDKNVSDIRQYIRLGPLGQALAHEGPCVLLIDEVDKADLEFPNDLLHELDTMRFDIPETGESVVAEDRPIVVITSNAEKELPDAFLRRCVFHYITFPNTVRLKEIIQVHFPKIEDELIQACLLKFIALRDVAGLRKKPSTSELLDWIGAMIKGGVSPEKLTDELPFLGTLIKKEEDLATVAQRRIRGGM